MTVAPRARGVLLATVAALLVLLATASPSWGHASLASTSPVDGSRVDAVTEVSLSFNEPISTPPGGIRVFDAQGERVDDGSPGNLAPDTVGVGVPADLPDGAYIVTWRVVSADGHPIKGAFVFTKGDGGEVDEALLTRLFEGDGGAFAAGLAGVARAAGYAGALLALGALAYTLAAAGDERERRRGRTWAARGAIAASAAAILTVPLQTMSVTGLGPLASLAPDVLADTLTSSVGQAAALRLVASVAVLLLARRAADDRLTASLALLGVLSFVVDGHTRTVEPAALMVAGDVVHLVAAAAWFGGLVVLLAALRERRLDDAPVEAAALVARYSRMATIGLVAVAVAGSAMSWALVRQPRALTSTAYGWTLVAKLGLVAVIVGIGAVNNRRLVPAVARAGRRVPAGGASDVATPVEGADVDAAARAGWATLRRTTRVEVGLMVAVLLVTGFLVNLRPAAEAAGITGIFEVTQPVSDQLTVNLVVDPNRAGENQVHLYLLDATGRPSSDVEGVLLRLRLPSRDIGPIEREPFVAGPGHWQLNGTELSIAGEWTLEVVVRVDRFTEQTVTVPVVVNPR